MSPTEENIYRQAAIKKANDARLFYAATGRTYEEQYKVWLELYESRPRQITFESWLQKRFAFMRRVAL